MEYNVLTRTVKSKTSKPFTLSFSALFLRIRNQLSGNVHIEDKFAIIALSLNHGNIFHSKCELRNFWLVVIIKTPIANGKMSH